MIEKIVYGFSLTILIIYKKLITSKQDSGKKYTSFKINGVAILKILSGLYYKKPHPLYWFLRKISFLDPAF